MLFRSCAGRACGAGGADGSGCTSRAGGAHRACRASFAGCASGASRPYRPHRACRTGGAWQPRHPHRASRTRQTPGAAGAYRPGNAAYAATIAGTAPTAAGVRFITIVSHWGITSLYHSARPAGCAESAAALPPRAGKHRAHSIVCAGAFPCPSYHLP